MSYRTPSWIKKYSAIRPLLVMAGFISICVQSNFVSAEDDWWFDVEVIVFKRNVSLAEISEKFPLAGPSEVSTNDVDLLTAYLNPDLSYLQNSLPVCNKPITPSVMWGPMPASADETAGDNLSDDAALQTDIQVELADSAMGNEPEIESSNSPKQTVPHEVIDDAGPESVSGVKIEDSFSQDPGVIDLNAETAQKTETAQYRPLFTAESIIASFVNIQIPEQLPCVYQDQLALTISPVENTVANSTPPRTPRVPIYIDGIEWTERNSPYLLPQSLLTLSALFTDIRRQQDLLPLLHVGWRQEVLFGEDKALPFRLFAGENFADRFSASGELLVEEVDPASDAVSESDFDVVSAVETALASNFGAGIEADAGAHTDEGTGTEAVTGNDTDTAKNSEQSDKEIELTSAKFEIESPDEESLFARIDKVLADDSPILLDETPDNVMPDLSIQQALSALWELDGKLKVYLQYVGRTPYLHIDTNLEYRSPVFVANKQLKKENNHQNAIVVGEKITQPNYLQSVQFDQLRRVVSKQLHYFDHPLFGMIVHITRYDRPEPEPEIETEIDDMAPLVEQNNPNNLNVESK